MKWRCADCGRVHDDPPERCACGSADVEPAAGDDGRFSPLAVRQRLLSPADADRSLISEEPYVRLLFRAVVALAVVALLVAAVALFV
ncbi:hypothetical protein BRC88_07630 [Halobacteriales archaeon QS_4_69_225]|nr:MAG: hypothetical protein BRC88_07630 [Halobacteriales archaeon QS_4_69_225]